MSIRSAKNQLGIVNLIRPRNSIEHALKGPGWLQVYLAHKKPPPPEDSTVALCLDTYGDPMGSNASHERGTPVSPLIKWDESRRALGGYVFYLCPNKYGILVLVLKQLSYLFQSRVPVQISGLNTPRRALGGHGSDLALPVFDPVGFLLRAIQDHSAHPTVCQSPCTDSEGAFFFWRFPASRGTSARWELVIGAISRIRRASFPPSTVELMVPLRLSNARTPSCMTTVPPPTPYVLRAIQDHSAPPPCVSHFVLHCFLKSMEVPILFSDVPLSTFVSVGSALGGLRNEPKGLRSRQHPDNSRANGTNSSLKCPHAFVHDHAAPQDTSCQCMLPQNLRQSSSSYFFRISSFDKSLSLSGVPTSPQDLTPNPWTLTPDP